MGDPITITISVLALLVSVLTAWMNLFRRGVLRITRPTFIAFNYDKVGNNGQEVKPKIFVRGLLYSTGVRGLVVQNMFIALKKGNSIHNFTVWGHGNKSLSRGSGLFIPPTGINENHHFNTPDYSTDLRYESGDYELKIFAEVVGLSKPRELFRENLTIESEELNGSLDKDAAIWFDWDPNTKKYHAHLESRSQQNIF